MDTFLAIILLVVAILLVVVMAAQALRGTVDLLSMRNFFLLGFILFQLSSPAMSLITDQWSVLPVTDTPRVAIIYTVLALVFLVCFFVFYSWGGPARVISAYVTTNAGSPGTTSMMTLAYAFLGLGLFLRFVVMYVPYLGVAAVALGSGLIVVAVALIGWAWAPRLWNPAVMVPSVILLMVAIFSVLAESFGRRDLVAVVGALAWGAYHGHWKFLGTKALFGRLAVLGFAGIILFGAVTATRNAEKLITSPGDVLRQLGSASPFEGLFDFGTGQFTGANSMWIIQTRPDIVEYDTLHTMRYVLSHPIPRRFWPDKPGALGQDLPDQARVRLVSKDLNLGPGIIGHIYNDNPWLAFVPYTIAIALILRIFDELIRQRPYNPFVVLPIAVGIGEIIALPRGEAGLFFVRALVYTAAAWVAMSVVARLLMTVGWVRRYDAEEHGWETTTGDEDGYGADDGTYGVPDADRR